ISEDQQATLVVLDVSTELLEHRNWSTLAKIDGLLERLQKEGKVPAGLEIATTGSGTVGRDITWGQAISARSTEFWTILLVIVLLLLIYRAPLLALIPLVTVFVSV